MVYFPVHRIILKKYKIFAAGTNKTAVPAIIYSYPVAKDTGNGHITKTDLDTAKFRRELLEAQQELQRFAFKLTADKEEANDLLQETSLKALDNMEKYTPDTNFKGWVYTIMRNIFINNYRKDVRDQTFIDHTDNQFHINSGNVTDDYLTDNGYDGKEIYRVVHSLPRDYRIPFLMHLAGFKYREIADRLQLPLGTVKSRIFFTRRQLQEMLKDYR